MNSRSQSRIRSKKASLTDEYDKHLDNSWWTVVDNTPEDVLTSPPKKLPPTREPEAVDQAPKGRTQASDPRLNPVTRSLLSRNPSAPVVSAEPVEVQHNMSKPLFPVARASERLGSFPTTPTKKKSVQEPPSTGSTRVLRDGMSTLGLHTPSKKGKERAFQPLSQPSRAPAGLQPIKCVFIDVGDDEEEEEVNDMLTGTDSPPSTRPASLFDSSQQQSAITSTSSWSADQHRDTGSWSSLEMENSVSAGRKRPRPSDGSEIEVQKLGSTVKPIITGDILVTPRLSKARKEDGQSSPRKSSLQTKSITVPMSGGIPTSVTSFFHGVLGSDLPPVIIAHSLEIQRLMDDLNLAWGVQYELARGVTLGYWTWEEVRCVLREKPRAFKGSNVEAAPKVSPVMRNRERAHGGGGGFTLWEELDREQAAIVENKGRGLGLMGSWHGQENWFGGRVQQVARLTKDDASRYRIQLEPMEKRRSHRFARFCGSRRILQLRVSTDLIRGDPKLESFLRGKFILCGRVFVPFHAKDQNLYMVETNENWERKPLIVAGDQHRLPFSAFINWHNPPEYNHKQALSKYVNRYALGLSTTIPVLEFEAENMYYIDDVYGSEYRGGTKPSAEETMTDGCGFINQAALVAINGHLNKKCLPVAIQARIAGAKGLWILHPDDSSPEFKIWIRDSQNKIKLTNLDRSHRILELVAASQPSGFVSISRQSIVNLSFNDVPDEILMAYLERGLVEEIEPLVNWDRPKAALHLWDAINTTGSVARSRLARVTTGISRVLGLTRRMWKEVETEKVDDGEDMFDEENTTFSGRNEYSKMPLSLYEVAIELVQAGFHPTQSKILQDKLQYIIEQAIKYCVQKYSIPLPESLEGFVVPDPLGVLEEGEIYYRSSRSLLDPRTQRTFDTLTGDVILGRYPIRLASDLQKVKAVNIAELYQWPDVIIASTKGVRSLASLLSGGDMDGDELFVLREPEIVEPFRNKTFVPPPPNLLEVNFQKHVETVSQFCERMKNKSPAEQHTALQSALMLGLNEGQKGLYSLFHDRAVEKYGYNHPKAIRLAYMFNTLLDASKSGLILGDGVFEKDGEEFGGNYSHVEDAYTGDPQSPVKRAGPPPIDPRSDAFILTKLERAGEAKGKELMAKFNDASRSCTRRIDTDLIAPYERATDFANERFKEKNIKYFVEDLRKIRDHVRKAQDEWSQACNKSKFKTPSKKQKATGSGGGNGTDVSMSAARMFAEPVKELLVTTRSDEEEIKASFAYREWPHSSFAFQVAFRQLCEIKARSTKGGTAPCIREIDEMKTIARSSIRAVEKSYND